MRSANEKSSSWISIVEKLSSAADLEQVLPEVLEEACRHFSLSSAFIYHADPYGRGFFTLQEHYARYTDARLPKFLDLHSLLGSEGLSELAGLHINFSCDQGRPDRAVAALVRTFQENFLMLIPVTDQKNSVIALVGFSDRRSCGMEEGDSSLAHAVLSSLASHIKLRLFQERVANAQRALEGILNNMGVDIYVNDFFTHEILYVNRSMAAPYGGVEEMMGKKCWSVIYNDKTEPCDYCPQRKLIDEQGNPTKIFTWDYQRPFDGSWFRVLSAAFPWSDGRLAHVVSSVDITENKKNEETIRQMAELDSLIGLPNRRKLFSDCENLIKDSGDKKGFYFFFLDLDNLRETNDMYGHSAGDELLVQIGRSFQDSSFTRESIYRHGGDEFVLLCDNDSPSHVLKVIESIRDVFARLIGPMGRAHNYTASVGIARYPSDGRTVRELLHHADLAMYHSKSSGMGHIHFYNEGSICTPEEYFKKKG